MRFAGRTAELAALRAASWHAVAVVGDPGHGKTRLLAEFAARARREGSAVLIGVARSSRPYGPFLDALHDWLACPDATDDDRAAAAELWPALSVTSGLTNAAPDAEDVLPGVRALLERIGRTRTAVLLLDDLHKADAQSAVLVAGLLRQPPRGRFRLVTGYRPRQAAPWLLATAPGRTVELAPLSSEDIRAACPHLCPGHARTAFEDTGGVPAYLDVLDSLCGRARCEGLAIADMPVSPVHTAALLTELDGLDGTARTVADAIAVLGDSTGVGLLSEVAEVDERALLAALDTLMARDLVRVAPSARHFGLRHAVLRLAVYWASPAGWRFGAHARAADALAGRGESVLRYAHHVERASHTDGDSSIQIMSNAARVVRDESPETAMRWYRTATALLPDAEADSFRRVELLTGIACTSALAGRLDVCGQAVRDIDELPAARLSTAQRAQVAECRALLTRFGGGYAAARMNLLTALATIASSGDVEAEARLRLGVAELAAWDVCVPDGRHVTDNALLVAIGSRRPVLQAHALALHAVSRLTHGAVDAAARSVREAARFVDGLPDGELAQRLGVLFALSWAELSLEAYDQARKHVDRGLAISRSTGQLPAAVPLLVASSATGLRVGTLDQATDHAAEALEIATRLDAPDLRAMAVSQVLAVAAVRGTPSSTGPPAASADTDSPWVRRAVLAQVVHGPAQGNHVKDILDLAGGPALPRVPAGERVACYGVLARAEGGPAARRWATLASGAAMALGLPGQLCGAELTSAAAHQDDPHLALHHARRALLAAGSAANPLDAGWAHLFAARGLAALGDPDAGGELALAAATAVRYGVAALTAEVDAVRALTATSDQARMGLELLSAREQEIAVLVSLGHTNRQIASALTVSHKTVETHLSRIFGKLGLSSRAEIATLVGESSATS